MWGEQGCHNLTTPTSQEALISESDRALPLRGVLKGRAGRSQRRNEKEEAEED